MGWRSPPLPLLLLLLFLLFFPSFLSLSAEGSPGFRVCAFNVQGFDAAKASNYRTMHTLTRILSRCDICLLQEVIDPDGKTIKALLASLNRYEAGRSYASVSSVGLGKEKQQYVFIYRKEEVNVTGHHQYQKKNSFTREPFTVHFQSRKTAIGRFVLVPLCAEPQQAVQEIDRLYDVFQEVSRKWNNTNVMFLGDFHAGCAFMSRPDKKRIRLFRAAFSWLIRDKTDTTATQDTSCAYDRIVVHGESFLKTIRPFSANVFDFGKEFKLSRTKVLELSDHFPIEVKLKSSAHFLVPTTPLKEATPLIFLILHYFLFSL